MFDEELKGKVTGLCEVLILVQPVCKSPKDVITPPHLTPPHPTPQHVMWANGLSYKWAIFRAASETFANWLLPDWHCCFGSQPGILWSVHAKVESSGAEPSISSPALKWRWAGWTDEIKQNEEHDAFRQDTPKKLNDGSTRDVKNRGFCARYWRNWFGASTRGSFPQTGSVLLSTPSQDIIMFMSPKWHGTTGICQSMAAHQGEFHQQRLAPRFEAWVQLTDQCLCPLALQNGMRLKEFLANLQTPIPIPMSTNFAVVTSRYLPLPFFFGQLILTRSRNTEMMWLGQWLIQTYFNRHISGLLGFKPHISPWGSGTQILSTANGVWWWALTFEIICATHSW